MKITIHSRCDLKRYTLPNKSELIFWGTRYTSCPPEEFAEEFQTAIDNLEPLAFDCLEEPGIFLLNDPKDGIVLYSDFAVPTSLYYSVIGTEVYCGNTDKRVAELIGRLEDIDRTGVYQRLSIGYTIGHRTRFQDVSALEPGSMVFINEQGIKRIKLSPHPCRNIELRDIYEALKEDVKRTKEAWPLGLMLSSGYDSRILLSVCNNLNIRLDSAYTHGPLNSLESDVAYKLAKISHVRRVIQVDAGMEMFGTRDDFLKLFEDIGYLYHPWWRLAGEYFRSRGVLPVCGVQAEILNGQYLQGPALVNNYWEKFNILTKGYTAYIRDKETFAEFFFHLVRDHLLKYMKPEFTRDIKKYKEETKEDLCSRARDYRESSVSWGNAVVRFLCDHDGSKIRAQQAEILRRYTPVFTPFTGRRIFSLCNSFEDKNKVYGKAMRQMLQEYAPTLARCRCTKSLVPVSSPDWQYFMGRIISPIAAAMRINKYLKIKGGGDFLPARNWIGGDIWIRECSEIDEFKGLITGFLLKEDSLCSWLDAVKSYKIAIGDGADLLRVIELDLLANTAFQSDLSHQVRPLTVAGIASGG